MLIVDGHLDLAYNTLVDGRNYLRSAQAIREDEAGGPVPDIVGQCMVGLPELLSARVAVIVATLTAIPRSQAQPGEAGYPNAEAAHQQAIAQLNIYRTWAREHPQVRLVTVRNDLEQVLETWNDSESPDRHQVGIVLLIENADILRTPDEVGFWWKQGVRMIGPAWHSNRYTFSNQEPGPLTDLGRALIDEMDRYGMALDLSHMADDAAREALGRFSGPVVASHSNPRRLVPSNRMIPDDLIRAIAERDGMLGLMPLNWALDPEWRRRGSLSDVSLDAFVGAVEMTIEIAGNTRCVGIGSDFDGGQGAESAPIELDTIADLPRIADALLSRGHSSGDLEQIMGGNWLRFLKKLLPDRVEAGTD